MKKSRCIFHYLHPLEKNAGVGSSVRPVKMRDAFEKIGYQVDEISGYGKARKKQIGAIVENIKSGIKYDFLYSESLTMPTLLAEEDHVPRYPCLDFGFLGFCRRNNIKVGLFYRDMHWKFQYYKESVPLYKRCVSIPLYKYDLYKYKTCVDVIYVPTEEFSGYGLSGLNLKQLQPGCDIDTEITEYKKAYMPTGGQLNVFYVGGITGPYDPFDFLEAVKKSVTARLTLCTPLEQWKEYGGRYKHFIGDHITVVHERGTGLRKLYREADVSVMCQKSNEYTDMAVPIKTKETLGYATPMIVSENLREVVKNVKREDCGWIVKPDVCDIAKLLDELAYNPKQIKEKTLNTIEAAIKNTWIKRAEQVVSDLTKW